MPGMPGMQGMQGMPGMQGMFNPMQGQQFGMPNMGMPQMGSGGRMANLIGGNVKGLGDKDHNEQI